ncbi:MAG: LysR family transcriptional regulator [Ramlibacter sp.]
MELKRLTHILALADEGNFSRAAERVHLSQPAFSRSIQAAEAELGLKLFDRGTVEASCTPSGAFVVERARRLLQENGRMEREVAMFRERVMGDVAIGSGPFPAATLMPALMQELRTRFPGIRSRVLVNNWRYLIEYLRKEEVDFFVADAREVPPDDDFTVTPIVRQRARFFVRTGHPLSGRRTLTLQDVAQFGLASGRLTALAAAGLRHIMGLTAEQELPIVVECDDIHLVKCITLGTDTVMIGTADIVKDELAAGQLSALEIKGVPKTYAEISVVALRGRSPSPMAEFAVDYLAQLGKQHRD